MKSNNQIKTAAEKKTYHSISPKTKIINEKPALLRKPDSGLAFQAASSSKGLEDPFDSDRSDGGESENGPDGKIDIIPALDVCTLFRLVVRQLQERGGIWSQRWVEIVKGEYHCEDSDADTYIYILLVISYFGWKSSISFIFTYLVLHHPLSKRGIFLWLHLDRPPAFNGRNTGIDFGNGIGLAGEGFRHCL